MHNTNGGVRVGECEHCITLLRILTTVFLYYIKPLCFWNGPQMTTKHHYCLEPVIEAIKYSHPSSSWLGTERTLDKRTQMLLFPLRVKKQNKKHVDKPMVRAHFYSSRFALPDRVAFKCEARTELVVCAPPLWVIVYFWRWSLLYAACVDFSKTLRDSIAFPNPEVLPPQLLLKCAVTQMLCIK